MELDSKLLSEVAYFTIPFRSTDRLQIICNYCSNHVFLEDDEEEIPNTDWVAIVAQHIYDVHPVLLRKR